MKFLSQKNNLIIFCFLALIVFLVFGNALFNDFVYDDGYLIIENKFIKSFSSIKEILFSDVTITSPLNQASGYYRPVSMIFLMLVYKIWGLNPFGWHLMSVLLHLANTFLVFLLLTRISQNRNIAFLASVAFAVHPIHVEAVAPVYNSMGLLASFFSLASFLAFLKSDGFQKKHYMFLSMGLLLLGLFAKEEAVVLPVIFAVYDYYFIARFSRPNFFSRWQGHAGFVAATLFYIFMRTLVIEKGAALGLWDLQLTFNITPAANLFWHSLTVIKIFYYYILMLVFPFHLSAFHVIPATSSLSDVVTIFSIVVVFELIICALYVRRRQPLFSFFTLLFFISTSPVSNIIPIGGIFAERFMYFPSIAYCFLFALVTEGLYRKFKGTQEQTKRNMVMLIASAIVLLSAFKSAERNYVWRNNLVLWRDTVEKSPSSVVARLNLADTYFNKKLYKEALGQYQVALSLSNFKEFQVHNSIGKIYGLQEEYDLALREFQRTVALDNDFAEGYYNLGITYFYKNDMHSAAENFSRARDLDPEYPWSYYGLGLVLEQKREWVLAKEMYRKTLDLDPGHELARQAWENLFP